MLQSNRRQFLQDVFEWDIVNWSTALQYWKDHLRVRLAGASALEIGAHDGGLSLWLAMQGANAICSDMRETRQQARDKHALYGIAQKIQYQQIDARAIPYENHFDAIVFKSLLGGVRGYFGDDAHFQVVRSIYRSLKPGGQLLFAENLEASGLHRLMRSRFVNWGKTWKYLKLDDIPPLFSGFAKLDFMSCGFAGTFGRTERQRRILGSFDRNFFNSVVPKHWHYIAIGVDTKAC